MKKHYKEISDSGRTARVGGKKKSKVGKKRRTFMSKEDAEKDRKEKTGIRTTKRGGGWN
jgi:hypothetical protein